jgi:glycosyltransferase involved in cell wall biosynthesis
MNVLHVHSGNLMGGVERMLETLAPATSGKNPITSSFALSFDGAVSEALRAAGAEVHTVGAVQARRPDSVVRARRALRQTLDRRAWDLACVHSSWSQAIFGPEIRRGGLPLVRWLHAPQPGPPWLERWAARSPAALVLCNSIYTHAGARSRLNGVPVAVQYPPTVINQHLNGDATEVRAELGTDKNSVVVAMVSRLEAGKGHRRFIDALSTLPQSGWEAWIIGGAQQPAELEYLTSLQRQAKAAGIETRIRFLGQRADVARLLGAADIYCQPNESPDSFGLSFVEALGAGLPVVTTRMGGVPEIVDSTCGVLTDPGSADALSAALRRLVESQTDRHVMGAAARARAATFCDLKKSLQSLAAQLTRALPITPTT